MAHRTIRILFLADTHLGFDLPLRPRVDRRRRGDDFFANYHRALLPAYGGDVDLVVHGGDVFFRSKIPPDLVLRVFDPLKRIADSGIPVVVVPGNHERSAIPYPILAAHPGIHIFDGPRTVTFNLHGIDVALSGFPCERKNVANCFANLVERTGWRDAAAGIRLLCIHQTVEGATVGPVDYMFRSNPDVIPGREIPHGFAAVLAGHIHRHQLLTHEPSGRPLASPVFYPGSTERTSAAEREETKGSLILEIEPDEVSGGTVRSWEFRPLPTRPMIDVELETDDLSGSHAALRLRQRLSALPPDAIVRVRMTKAGQSFPLTSRQLREIAPITMNIEVTRDSRARFE